MQLNIAGLRRSVARLILDNAQRFVSGAFVGGALFAVLVGGLCYFLVREEPFWQLAVVSTLVALGTMLAGVVWGVRLAATETLRGWVEATGVGPMLSKVIFKQALGVSDKRPGGSSEITAELQGATLGEAKTKLAARLGAIFSGNSLDRWLPAQGRWLAKRLTSAAGWAVTRTLLDRFPESDRDGEPINLLALRDGLSTGLADKAVTLVTARATIVALGAVLVAAVVCVLVAVLLSL
jgi:hypothetical protein